MIFREKLKILAVYFATREGYNLRTIGNKSAMEMRQQAQNITYLFFMKH